MWHCTIVISLIIYSCHAVSSCSYYVSVSTTTSYVGYRATYRSCGFWDWDRCRDGLVRYLLLNIYFTINYYNLFIILQNITQSKIKVFMWGQDLVIMELKNQNIFGSITNNVNFIKDNKNAKIIVIFHNKYIQNNTNITNTNLHYNIELVLWHNTKRLIVIDCSVVRVMVLSQTVNVWLYFLNKLL